MSTQQEMHIIGSPEYYEALLKKHPHDQKIYERLMVLYRQQKNYKKELKIINTAIKTFEPILLRGKSANRKINTISNELNRSLGLVDKKGKMIYEPAPLPAWRKRKEVVLKKIGK